MKKGQLLSILFSMIMFTGLAAGTAVAFAESRDDNYDFEDRLEKYCEMSAEDKAAFIEKHDKAEDHQEKMTEYCLLDESERKAFIEEYADEYKRHDYNIREKMDEFCEMSAEDKAAFIEKHDKAEDHQEKMTEYCLLDESERKAFIEEYADEYKRHDYNIREKMDEFCEMSAEDKIAFIEKYPMASKYKEKMVEYCLLDSADRDAFIDEFKDSMNDKMSGYKDSMNDKMSGYKDSMNDKMSGYKDSMNDKMSGYKDSMNNKMLDHRDTMKDKISDHKDSMKSENKSRTILRASTLTDEQKVDIRAMHSELRDFKHSLRDKSISDSDKQEIREQFMEKAKEFAMTWISPRHQVAAGIDAQLVECREGFELVMKTSNASPLCVKETTAEKLIERGIVIYAI